MFMRESEGVYNFGSRRVAVKVEKDSIKIRVGGGYLSIDEFIDQYTPVELEKLEELMVKLMEEMGLKLQLMEVQHFTLVVVEVIQMPLEVILNQEVKVERVVDRDLQEVLGLE